MLFHLHSQKKNKMELVIGHIVLKCCDGTGGIAFKFWYEKNLIGNVYSSLNESYVM